MYHRVSSTLNPESWPFSIELLPLPAYMVGGAVRDALLGRTREYLDLDFVLPSNAVLVARTIAKQYKAGFVLLDSERQIARVVFPHATVDFAQLEGDSLETDLHRRDFTVNAIAYNPHTQEIIDPLQGYADLQLRLLKMVSPANLEDDPLRLLRAYRQASQLDFTIEPTTRSVIRSLASHITKVAAERVRVEIGYMLHTSHGTTWLTTAWTDGLLAHLFTSATQESFMQLKAVDTAAAKLVQTIKLFGQELHKHVRDTIKTTWLGIAKLACLVNSMPQIAEIELQQLTYSRAEIKAVTTALRLFPRLEAPNFMSLPEQYDLFQSAGIVFPAILVLAVAHDNLVEAMSDDKTQSVYVPLITRYLNPDDLVAHPKPLVSGRTLIITLKISASPLIGKLLNKIAIAQIEGRISTPTQAIEYARQLMEEKIVETGF